MYNLWTFANIDIIMKTFLKVYQLISLNKREKDHNSMLL